MGIPTSNTILELNSTSPNFSISGSTDPNYVISLDFGSAYFNGTFVNPGLTAIVTGGVTTFNSPGIGSGAPITVEENYDDSVGAFILSGDQSGFTFIMSAVQADNFGVGSFSFNVSASGASTDTDTVTVNILLCYAEGTEISTPQGRVAVEDLQIGDLVCCEDGRDLPVKWVGHQSVARAEMNAATEPVRITAGALGNDKDLVVTADHGMIIDGLVINASALVNGDTIDFVPQSEMPAVMNYYHVETEDHAVIYANGAPSETFLDIPGRRAFENYDEYLDLYQFERIIPEMKRPRISSKRLVPDAIKARLGINEQSNIFVDLIA